METMHIYKEGFQVIKCLIIRTDDDEFDANVKKRIGINGESCC